MRPFNWATRPSAKIKNTQRERFLKSLSFFYVFKAANNLARALDCNRNWFAFETNFNRRQVKNESLECSIAREHLPEPQRWPGHELWGCLKRF